jgi:hypothetical protein
MFAGMAVLDQVTEEMEEFATKLIDSERAYVMFMSILDDLPATLDSGEAEYECPCAEWSADVMAILTEDPDPFDTGASMGAQYSGGNWLHKDAKRDPASSYYYRSVSLKLVFPAARITRIAFPDYTLLAFDYDDLRVYLDDDMDAEGKWWNHDATGTHMSWSTPEFSWTTTQINVLGTCDRNINIGNLNGAVTLYAMTVYGRGFNPFA